MLEKMFEGGMFRKEIAPFNFWFWSLFLIFGTYVSFLIYKPLAGVFIGWYLTETYHSLKEVNKKVKNK